MTRTSRASAVPALLLTAALTLTGCGGGSTPTATPGSGATTAPAATGEGPATGAPAASGGINLGGAAASLDDLDNYSFKMIISSEGAADGMMGLVKAGGSITMEGTVVMRPAEAADVMMTLSDGKTATNIGYRIIGDTAYTSFGDTWMSTPAEDARKAIDSFKPDKMLSGFSDMEGLTKVGDEDKNGIATEHYNSSVEPGAGASSIFGLPDATWQTDVWVARQGSFVVSAVMTATGKTETGEAGSFTVAVDVTAVNSPDVMIEAPKDVMEVPT